jgi:hypothetical protein
MHDDIRSATQLARWTARSMSQRRITKHQIDRARGNRLQRPSAGAEGILILICVAGDEIASSHGYALSRSEDLPRTAPALLTDLETKIALLVRGEDLDSQSSDDEISIPERAMSFIEAAAETLRVCRVPYVRRR